MNNEQWTVESEQWTVGGWRLAVGGWRLAVGGWRLAVGGWRLAVGGWRLAVGNEKQINSYTTKINFNPMIKIYHNPRCTKSREGLHLLETSGEKFEVVRYLEKVPSKAELSEIISQLGISPLKLVRKNEAIWKDRFRGKELTDDQIIEAMVEFPKLIERPIVIKDNKAVIGRPLDNISLLLKR